MEFEHKFIMELAPYLALLSKTSTIYGPCGPYHQKDTYFLPKTPGWIYRLRETLFAGGKEVEMTAKSYPGDIEAREEITISLSPKHLHGQVVREFLGTGGVVWEGSLLKRTFLFRIDDCTVTFAAAQAEGMPAHCYSVEIEYMGTLNRSNPIESEEARAGINEVARKMGLSNLPRERRSLFDILLKPQIPAGLVAT